MSGAEETAAEPDPVDCGRCGVRLRGRWCHDCGQDSRPRDRSARDLLEDVLDNVFSFTGAVPSTARALLLRPSLVPRAQLAGDGRILSPMKLYLTASLVFFLFLGLSGVTFFQLSVERTGEPHAAIVAEGGYEAPGFRVVDEWLRPRNDADPDPPAPIQPRSTAAATKTTRHGRVGTSANPRHCPRIDPPACKWSVAATRAAPWLWPK